MFREPSSDFKLNNIGMIVSHLLKIVHKWKSGVFRNVKALNEEIKLLSEKRVDVGLCKEELKKANPRQRLKERTSLNVIFSCLIVEIGNNRHLICISLK